MSSDSKSLPSLNQPQGATTRPIPQNPSQTPPRLRREYFPAGFRPVGVKTQDVDSGGRLLQGPLHAFGVMRDDGQIRPRRLIGFRAALLPIPQRA